MQDLTKFRLPKGFRGRSAIFVQFWWIVQIIFFRCSPQVAYRWRASVLRCFGAVVGKGSVIRSSVTVTYPWKVSIGDNVWIGDDVCLYSLGTIAIGDKSVVSQGSYICAADHDYTKDDFPIRARPITIGSEVWVGSDVFIAPGVSIGDRSVVGARSSVFKSLPGGMVCFGSPCHPVKPR